MDMPDRGRHTNRSKTMSEKTCAACDYLIARIAEASPLPVNQ